MRPIASSVLAVILVTAGAAAQAAPEPALVRLTALGSGHYMDHGGGNRSAVYAQSGTPIDRDANNDAILTDGPDIWHLVDWDGGTLLSGDQVSFATEAAKEPYYMRSTSCGAGAKPHTQKRATMSSGLGTNDIFRIHAVSQGLVCNPRFPGSCVPTLSLAAAGTPIRNGSTVAIETPQGCFLYESDSTEVLGDRTVVSSLAPRPAWRIWYKVVPRDDDDFPGHADLCFGGMGAGCWTNPSLWPFSGTGTWRTEASGDGFETFKRIDVSVGSIAHDNCCLRNPLGKVCGGVFSGAQVTSAGVTPPRGIMSVSVLAGGEVWQGTRCEWEWQRAIDNGVLLATWTREFGGYYSDATRACPGCRTKDALAWGLTSERLFKSSTMRQAWLAKDFGWKKWTSDLPAGHYPDGTNEVDNTEVISAPVGTHIYPNGVYPDESILGDFCSTRTAYWDVWTSAWVCAEIQCGSGIAYWDVWTLSWRCES
jgi:hypothetical protein